MGFIKPKVVTFLYSQKISDMGKNVVNTIGYHACLMKEGQNDAFLKINAPFRSCRSKVKGKQVYRFPFIGEGYYFWDDDINHAKWWGRTHYNGRYHIVSLEMQLSGDFFLDVVGSISDQRQFLSYLSAINDKYEKDERCKRLFNDKKMTISQAVWLLQRIAEKDPAFFPYRIIRIVDVTKSNIMKQRISDVQPDEVILKQSNIICFFDRKDLDLSGLNIVI